MTTADLSFMDYIGKDASCETQHHAPTLQMQFLVITSLQAKGVACKATTDHTHNKGLSQNILQLGTRDSFVPATHCSSGSQIKLHHGMPDIRQSGSSVGCTG